MGGLAKEFPLFLQSLLTIFFINLKDLFLCVWVFRLHGYLRSMYMPEEGIRSLWNPPSSESPYRFWESNPGLRCSSSWRHLSGPERAACENLFSLPAVGVTRPERKKWGLVASAIAHGAGSLAPLPFMCMCMMCVVPACLCVSAGLHMLPCMYGGQRATAGAPCPSLFETVFVVSHVVACELRGSVLPPCLTLLATGDLNSGTH